MKIRLLVLLAVVLFFSCKKKQEEKPPLLPDPKIPSLALTEVPGSEAILQAAYVGSLEHDNLGSYTFFKGIANGVFYDNSGKPAHAKKVICEGYELDRDLNNYQSNTPHIYGLDFGSSVSWEVAGHNAVPAFTEEILQRVPEIGNLNVSDSLDTRDTVWLKIDISSPFTNLGAIDSVRFSIIGKANTYTFSVLHPNDSVAISPEQLQSCTTGKCYLQAEAVYITKKSYQGYSVAFVNKGMFYKPVWLY